MQTTILAIDIMETSQGYMVLFEDDYLTNEEGDNVFDTYLDALQALKDRLNKE